MSRPRIYYCTTGWDEFDYERSLRRRVNEKVNERFRIATISFPSLYPRFSSSFVAFVSLGFVQFVALCFKRPFTSKFLFFPRLLRPHPPPEIQLFSARSARAFLFSRQLGAPSTIMWVGTGFDVSKRKTTIFPRCFERRSKSRWRSLILCAVNSIEHDSLLPGILFGM